VEQRTAKLGQYDQPWSGSYGLHLRFRLGRRFLVRWILATMPGAGLGIAIGLIGASGLLAAPAKFVLWSVVGALVGIGQRLVLQRQVKVDNWLWASIAGWTVGGILSGAEGVNWAIMGSVVGLLQGFVLRQFSRRAGWWVVVNAAGLITGAITGWGIRFTSPWPRFVEAAGLTEPVTEVISWGVAAVVGGTVSALITGLGLVWLQSLGRRSGVGPPAAAGHGQEKER
jgi:hypothetical protein